MPDSKTPASAKPGWWSAAKAWASPKYIVTALASLIVLIGSPFLLVSESSIKSYVEDWLSGCLFVLDKQQLRPDRVRVRGYLYGKAPKELPITFSAGGATINRIQMINEIETESGSETRGLHPQTNWACPGTFCEEYGRDASAPKMTLVLSDINAEFGYAFNVDFDKPLDRDRLKLYVQFDSGLSSGVCRIEEAGVFNWYVRQTKLKKFFVLIAAFIVLSVVVAVFKKMLGGN